MITCNYCRGEVPKGRYPFMLGRVIAYCDEWCKHRAARLRQGFRYKNQGRYREYQEVDENYLIRQVISALRKDEHGT